MLLVALVLAGTNPVLPGWNADPEIRVFGGVYYLYPTVDDGPKEAYFDAWRSPDLARWTRVPRVFDFSRSAWTGNRLAWAPSVVERRGRYYLYFAANDGAGIGVAVGPSPVGPFRDALKKPVVGPANGVAHPIDPMAFVDADGKAYLYWGGHGRGAVARLKDDMVALAEPPRPIAPEGFVEAPFTFRRKGLYYLGWSEGNWMDATYGVAYATARSPYGPFVRRAKILQGDGKIGNGAGHHSVVNVPGTDEWIIAYHRRPIAESAPGHRAVCLERLRFAPDGSILPVKLTEEGVPPTTPRPPR